MRRERRLGRASTLDIAADKRPELSDIIGHAAHESTRDASVRRERFVLLERDVGRSSAGTGRVHIVGREAVFAHNDAVLVEKLAAGNDALIAHGGRRGLGEDAAGGVFGLAHVEGEEGEGVREIFVGDGVEPQVSAWVPDLVVIGQGGDIDVFSVCFESVLEDAVDFLSFGYEVVVVL